MYSGATNKINYYTIYGRLKLFTQNDSVIYSLKVYLLKLLMNKHTHSDTQDSVFSCFQVVVVHYHFQHEHSYCNSLKLYIEPKN